MKQRIWELDALRGICILGMVIVHFIFDAVELYGLLDWEYSGIFSFLKDWGGVLFLLLSGTCVTLGSRSVRRGVIIFTCGALCTAVTGGMYLLGLASVGVIIWFGALHCLGICMLLWPVFRKWKPWQLLAFGGALALLGLYLLENVRVPFDFLAPLGLYSKRFASADYFPLLPHLGFFLMGAACGKQFYVKRESLLPGVNADRAVPRFLQACGRHSLWIYLLHQPVLTVFFTIITMFI